MSSFNKVILMGNLTRDPELRYTPSGSAVAEISMAINRTWKDRQTNEKREEVTFVEVTLWGRTAEIANEYLRKGRPVMIEGRLQLDKWEDKETGKNRSKLKVVGDTLQLLGGRDSNGGNSGESGQSAGNQAGYGAAHSPQVGPSAFEDEETPF
ncbi:MAG: single-stranded DNA-binding protein [Fuerstiella sp.]